jgi:hypothetical protein
LPGRCPGPLPPSGWLYLPAAGGPAQPEGGQAGQVGRGSQELPVLGHPHQPADPGAAAAMAAAQQVGELALHLGPGRPVVGPPCGIALAGTGRSQLGLARTDRDHSTPNAGGAGIAQRADTARGAEPGPPTTATGWDDRHLNPGRAGDRLGLEVDAELVLANRPPGAVGSWVVIIGVNPWVSSQARWVPVP